MSRTSKRSSKSVMLPGAHRQVHQRAAGHAIYWYAWRGGPQIAMFRGDTLEAAEAAELDGAGEIAEGYARERRPKPANGTVAAAIHAWVTSAEFKDLAPTTQHAWGSWLEIVRQKWGHLSGDEFSSDDTAGEIRTWRDDIAKRSKSSADKAVEAISRLCSYARLKSVKKLPPDCNPTEELGKVYHAPPKLAPRRSDVLDALKVLPPLANAICDIALNTGLRRSDLVRLCDTHVDEAGGVIRIDTKKGNRQGRVATIRLTPPLLAAIRRAQSIRDARYAELMARPARRDRAKPVQVLNVIVNRNCRAFTPSGLYQHCRDAFEAAALENIAPHGFRRAAATQGFVNGLSWAQIGRQLGWGEDEAEKMGAIYVLDEAAEKQG